MTPSKSNVPRDYPYGSILRYHLGDHHPRPNPKYWSTHIPRISFLHYNSANITTPSSYEVKTETANIKYPEHNISIYGGAESCLLQMWRTGPREDCPEDALRCYSCGESGYLARSTRCQKYKAAVENLRQQDRQRAVLASSFVGGSCPGAKLTTKKG
jgi:hypothetical protein